MSQAFKQRGLAMARALGLLPVLERGRYLLAARQSAQENEKFLAEHPEFSPPPLWWMHDMYRHTSYAQYAETGARTAAAIAEKIDSYIDDEAPRVADWGCGLARVIRHLPERYQRFGFDYNQAAIEWCTENIKGVEFAPNELLPPLPVAEGAFDALYALSVFTHLSEQAHRDWIGEIQRVLRPGGVLLAAFHMRLPAGQLLPEEQKSFDRGELVVRGRVKEGSRTYTAHHPEPYLRERLLKDFDVLEEPFDLFGQTVFAARVK